MAIGRNKKEASKEGIFYTHRFQMWGSPCAMQSPRGSQVVVRWQETVAKGKSGAESVLSFPQERRDKAE